MAVCLEVAGAQRGALVLDEEGLLAIRVVGSAFGAVTIGKTALGGSDQVPRTVVEHVFRTTAPVVLGDAARQGSFTADPYIVNHEAKSILTLAIVRQSKAIGVLYLENNLATRAFTSERVRVVTLLSSQIAISLENSRLF